MKFFKGLLGSIFALCLPTFAVLHVLGIVHPVVSADGLIAFYIFLCILCFIGIRMVKGTENTSDEPDGQSSGDL